MSSLVAVLALALQEPQVDPGCVGTWTLEIKNAQGTWVLTTTIRADGTYSGSTRGPVAIPDESGTFRAQDGKWSLKAGTGRTDAGTYQVPDRDTMVLVGPLGPARWRRVAPAAPPPPAPVPAAPAGPLADDPLTPPKEPDPTVLDYLLGLDALETGRWADALASFDRAIQAQPKIHPYRYGRVIALLFSERFPDFLKELDAAYELHNPREDRELRCLLAMGCTMARSTQKLFWYHPSWLEHGYDRHLNEIAGAYARDAASARPAFPDLAARFAADRRRDDTLGLALLWRGFERQKKGDFAAAARDYALVLDRFPYNFTAMGKRAECLRVLGADEAARRLFSQFLSYRTQSSDGYLGRALAATRQGDAARAKSDFAIAEKLNAAKTAEFRRAHPEVLNAAPPSLPDPAAVHDALVQAVRSGAPPERVKVLASALRLAMNARRVRFDESYQERRRQLEWAKAADPSNPDRLADLGNHLRLEAVPRGECVETRGAFQYYRFFEPRLQQIERDAARTFLNAALKINPNHVPSLVGLAGLEIKQLQWAEAEARLGRAAALQPDAPALPELMVEVLDHNASVQHWNAARLRAWQTEEVEYDYTTTDTKSEQVGAGLYRITTTTSRHTGSFLGYRLSTPEELAQAAAHEAQGKKLSALAQGVLKRASNGSAEGRFYAGLAARREGKPADAIRALGECLKLDPGRGRAREELGLALADAGRIDESNETFDEARNADQTTAGVQLRLAWAALEDRKSAVARTLLERARRRDPADARIATYRAIAEFLDKNDAEAIVWSRVALAQEEARLKEAVGFVPLKEHGLALRSRLFLGELLLKTGKAEEAAAAFRANLTEGATRFQLGTDMDLGITPLTFGGKDTPREPAFLAALLARSRWGAARALKAAGKADESRQEIAAALGYRRMYDDSLQINPITVRPGHKAPELETFLRSISK